MFATAAAFASPPGGKGSSSTSRQTIAGTKPAWAAATK
jgi:hypothetical protein